jgi:hypothetical protein
MAYPRLKNAELGVNCNDHIARGAIDVEEPLSISAKIGGIGIGEFRKQRYRFVTNSLCMAPTSPRATAPGETLSAARILKVTSTMATSSQDKRANLRLVEPCQLGSRIQFWPTWRFREFTFHPIIGKLN